MIVKFLHHYENTNIYNITQAITLDKTTPIIGSFFSDAITATRLAIMPIHIFSSTYNIAGKIKDAIAVYGINCKNVANFPDT